MTAHYSLQSTRNDFKLILFLCANKTRESQSLYKLPKLVELTGENDKPEQVYEENARSKGGLVKERNILYWKSEVVKDFEVDSIISKKT